MSVAIVKPAIVTPTALPETAQRRPRPSLRPAPPLEPPYDEDIHTVRANYTPSTVRHHADVLPFVPPGRAPAAPEERVRGFAPAPPRRGLPPAMPWAGRLLQAALEVQAGQRGLHQLAPWTSEQVYIQLSWWVRRSPSAPAQVKSVHVCEPAEGVAEVSAVIRRATGRSQAVAARLEGTDGRWRCTSLRFL